MAHKIVVIDPGHGGSQSGGVNKKFGYKEKDIVLKVAKYMLEYGSDKYSDTIIWDATRLSDTTKSLQGRCDMANNNKADIFISIHTNARVLKGRYGLEIETYHHEGSYTGRMLAEIVQRNLVSDENALPTIDRGVKIGKRWSKKKQKWMSFYVLKYTHMPAVLVELGFLSDDEEAELLSKEAYQMTAARVLVDSLGEFFKV